MTRKSFMYGNEKFEYEINFSQRRRRRIAIHVRPDATVGVSAPADRSEEDVHAAVLGRAEWISKHVSAARGLREHVLPRNYVSGESFLYLGRRYQLKVDRRCAGAPSVKLFRGHLRVEGTKKDSGAVKKQVDRWYRDRAREVFGRRMESLFDTVTWADTIPEWRLLKMKRQWGSCSSQGTIILNPHLVKAPRECVDYVILHELCHLREHNHSPRFYGLLDRIMPEWRRVKDRLESMAEAILNE